MCTSSSVSLDLVAGKVAVAKSSMKTFESPDRTKGSKTSFMRFWKVAGELVIPKGITVNSYSPRFVMKAVFHSSPGLMRMLWKPARTSTSENRTFPLQS